MIDVELVDDRTLAVAIDGKHLTGYLHPRSNLIKFEAFAEEWTSPDRDELEHAILPDLLQELNADHRGRRTPMWRTFRIRYYHIETLKVFE